MTARGRLDKIGRQGGRRWPTIVQLGSAWRAGCWFSPRSGLSLAGGLLVLAAIGYALIAIWGILSNGLYFAINGELTRIDRYALVVGFGPLALLSGYLARQVLYERSFRVVVIGFATWLVVAVLDSAILGDMGLAFGVALTAVLPLALVLGHKDRFADLRLRT